MRGDQYQKVHRVRRGEIIAILPGALHWLYNDGNKELVTVSVINLNSENNQLDLNLRVTIPPHFCLNDIPCVYHAYAPLCCTCTSTCKHVKYRNKNKFSKIAPKQRIKILSCQCWLIMDY